MNLGEFKDPVCDLCLGGCVVTSWCKASVASNEMISIQSLHQCLTSLTSSKTTLVANTFASFTLCANVHDMYVFGDYSANAEKS